MTHEVVSLKEVEKVSHIMHILNTTAHHGYPIVNEQGQLRGFILRRTLCSLLTYKAYSVPTGKERGSEVEVIAASTVAYDTMERSYPVYPTVADIKLTDVEMTYWLDVKPYMDHAPFMMYQDTTLLRTYSLFRTMGLRHLPVVDGDMKVVGMITRANLAEHNLHHIWEAEKDNMIKSMTVDVAEARYVTDEPNSTTRGFGDYNNANNDARRGSDAVAPEILQLNLEGDNVEAELELAKSEEEEQPYTVLRKTLSPR